ncbi:hypothetical protein GQ457_14G019820 [Hibiscus cannabinus]
MFPLCIEKDRIPDLPKQPTHVISENFTIVSSWYRPLIPPRPLHRPKLSVGNHSCTCVVVRHGKPFEGSLRTKSFFSYDLLFQPRRSFFRHASSINEFLVYIDITTDTTINWNFYKTQLAASSSHAEATNLGYKATVDIDPNSVTPNLNAKLEQA